MVHIIPRLAITTCEPTRFVLYSCHFNNDNGGGGGGGKDGTTLRTLLIKNTCILVNKIIITTGRFLSEQQGIGGIFILAECFLTDFKRISLKIMSVSSKILLMERIYEYPFCETKFS